MKLKAYLTAIDETESAFARRAKLPQRTVNRVANGGGCRADTALVIIRASHSRPAPGGGVVALEDLLGQVDAA